MPGFHRETKLAAQSACWQQSQSEPNQIPTVSIVYKLAAPTTIGTKIIYTILFMSVISNLILQVEAKPKKNSEEETSENINSLSLLSSNKAICHSLLPKQITLFQPSQIVTYANQLFAWIKCVAPESFNRPKEFDIRSTIVISSESAEELHTRTNKLDNFFSDSDLKWKIVERKFNKKLEEDFPYNEPAVSLGDQVFSLNQIATKFLGDPLNYLMEVHEMSFFHALSQKWRGGVCGSQAKAVAIEALRLGLDVEQVSFGDVSHGHQFIVLGRDWKNSDKQDILTWGGNDTYIIDPWAFKRPISITEIKNNPKRFYFYLHMQGDLKVSLYKPKLDIASLDSFNIDQSLISLLKMYLNKVQDVLNNIIKTDMELPVVENKMQL